MNDKSNFKISDYFWALELEMLTGRFSFYDFLAQILVHGVKTKIGIGSF
jgi:hypothetical protein